MPRRTHYARLQKVEWRSGTCLCQQPRVLVCAKAIEAHERGELVKERCPAGCAPEKRLVIALRLSAWSSGAECACPTCDPGRQTALIRQGLQRALPSGNEHDGASQQYSDGTSDPVTDSERRAPRNDAAAPDGSEPQPDAARAPAGSYGPDAGRVEALPASEATVELVRPRVSVPLGAPPPQLGPEDVVGGPEPHGNCAIPWCHHPLQAHRSYTERLPCRHCGWPVHDHTGFEPGLAYASRRLMPCGVYIAIRFDGGEWDGCSMGCGCPGWRRRPPYQSEHDARIQALLDEKDRVIARNEEKLEHLRTECERLQLEMLRAEGLTDNGPRPHGCPVYVEGDSA